MSLREGAGVVPRKRRGLDSCVKRLNVTRDSDDDHRKNAVMEKTTAHTASAGGAATAAAETAHHERYLWPDDAAPYECLGALHSRTPKSQR